MVLPEWIGSTGLVVIDVVEAHASAHCCCRPSGAHSAGVRRGETFAIDCKATVRRRWKICPRTNSGQPAICCFYAATSSSSRPPATARRAPAQFALAWVAKSTWVRSGVRQSLMAIIWAVIIWAIARRVASKP